MPIALRRYTNIFNKIPQIIIRGTWRNSDVPLSAVHNCRLESMISVGDFIIIVRMFFCALAEL